MIYILFFSYFYRSAYYYLIHMTALGFSTYERSSSSHVIPQVSPLINISLADDGPIFDIVSHKENGSYSIL